MTHRHPSEIHAECATASLAARASDFVTGGMATWRFVIGQQAFFCLWFALNTVAWFFHWDPYPFVLANLCLSMEAAQSSSIIMMSQNRQSSLDRAHAENAYEQIEHLLRLNEHDQMDKLDLIARKIDAHHRLTKHEEKPQ